METIHPDLVWFFLEKGTHPNQQNELGETSLIHTLCPYKGNQSERMKITVLLEQGGRPGYSGLIRKKRGGNDLGNYCSEITLSTPV